MFSVIGPQSVCSDKTEDTATTDSHGSDYEEYCLVECDAVYFYINSHVFLVKLFVQLQSMICKNDALQNFS
jgi:hypothetical protein